MIYIWIDRAGNCCIFIVWMLKLNYFLRWLFVAFVCIISIHRQFEHCLVQLFIDLLTFNFNTVSKGEALHIYRNGKKMWTFDITDFFHQLFSYLLSFYVASSVILTLACVCSVRCTFSKRLTKFFFSTFLWVFVCWVTLSSSGLYFKSNWR